MRIKVILSVTLFISIVGVLAASVAQDPITAKQLLAWVVGGMSVDHLSGEVGSRGIAFHADEEYIESLKIAGAPEKVLALLPRAEKGQGPIPTTDPAFEQLAAAAKALGAKDYKAAGMALSAAVQLEPQNPDLSFALGGLFTQVEDWEQAAQAYHQATHLSPDFLPAHLGLSYACYRVGDVGCAEAESKLALRLMPNDAEAHKDLGQAYMLGGEALNATREYREAIRLKPDYSSAYYDLGIALHDLEEWDASIAAYQRAIQLDPNNWSHYYNLGISFANKGDHTNAIAVYRKAKQLDPTQLVVRQNLGGQLCATEQYPEAIKEFRELLAIDPDWNMARGCLGDALYSTGHPDEAVTVYKEALRQDPTDETARLGLGIDYYNKKQYPQAEAEYRRAEQVNPASPYPHWNLGRLYYVQGKHEASAAELEKAVRIDPKQEEWLLWLARDNLILEHNGRAQQLYEQRLALLKTALSENDPKMAEAQAELALQLGKQRKYDEAKPLFLAAIKTLGQAPNPTENGLDTIVNNYQAMLREERDQTPAVPPSQPPAASPVIVASPGGMPLLGAGQSPLEKNLIDDLQLAFKARNAGKPEDEERYFRQAVADAEKISPQDARLVTTLMQFADSYMMRRRPEDAELTMIRALEAANRIAGSESTLSADVLVALTRYDLMFNKLDAAEKYATRNLQIREQEPSITDPRLVEALDLMGSVYSQGKRYEQAESPYQRALDITEKAYGPEAVNLAIPLDHLGGFYRISGQFAKAEPIYRRVLAIEEKVYGPDSPVLLGFLSSLTEVLRNEGRPAEADELQKRRDAISARQRPTP